MAKHESYQIFLQEEIAVQGTTEFDHRKRYSGTLTVDATNLEIRKEQYQESSIFINTHPDIWFLHSHVQSHI